MDNYKKWRTNTEYLNKDTGEFISKYRVRNGEFYIKGKEVKVDTTDKHVNIRTIRYFVTEGMSNLFNF